MDMARPSSTLSGMCLPCAVVLEAGGGCPGPGDVEYGCCLNAPAVPGWKLFGGGLYIVGSPGRTIDRER